MITLEGNARAGVLSLLLLGLCLTLPVATRAQDQAAGGRPEMRPLPRRLTVTGEGKVQIRPDKADITIGVVTDNKSSQAAAHANAEASQAVQDAVKKLGIPDKDIQTVNYSVQPLIPGAFGGGQQQKITGYRVYNQVRVTVRNVDRVGEVIDAATNAGSNTVEGISFGLQNDQTVMDQAMAQAVADARRKADILAKAAGVDIVGIYEINEGSGARPVPMFRSMAAEAAATPIQPGELTSTANVTVVYEISAMHRAARVAPLRRQAQTKTGIKTARAVL